MILRRAL